MCVCGMYVSMYVCVYVCMCVCIYIYICIHITLYACIHISFRKQTIHTNDFIDGHINTYYMYIIVRHVCVCACLCLHVVA